MAYTKDYETIIPLPRDQATADELAAAGIELGTQWPIDDVLLVWLVRESFDRAAQNWSLELVEFTDEGEVNPEDRDPKHMEPLLERLQLPATDFIWRKFTGKARRPAAVLAAIAADLDDQRAAIEAEAAEGEAPQRRTRKKKNDAESS